MIKFEGYDNIIERVYDNKQEHIFHYWKELNNKEKEYLLSEVSEIDFNHMNDLYSNTAAHVIKKKYKPSPYIPLPESAEDNELYKSAENIGRKFLSTGKTAAILVAGGQGTRLGYDGPKGKYPVGPVSHKTLFQIHAEKILKNSQKYNCSIPWLIMTSKTNNIETVEFIKTNNYFGLDKKDVYFFTQRMMPSLDTKGKLILKTKSSLFMNPDGHGGTLTALADSGLLKKMKQRGIELLSSFQVDNPLVQVIDPVFIGFHIKNNSDVSSKASIKTGPGEKVGVFVEYNDGKTGIVEYSDMTDEEKNATDNNDKLLFSMGNLAVHLFNISFIESITSGGELSLPYHTAKKKIKAFNENSVNKIDGMKFEKFIFDALSLTSKNTILEVKREKQFAPVKNAEGTDSPASAKKLMNNLHFTWLKERNISVPDKVKVMEISPLMAVEPDDLPDNLNIPAEEEVYLE